jgi:peptidoglycan hydrolase-like protein with peptidoglycan-binding domain
MKSGSAMKDGKSGRAAAGGNTEQVKAVQQALKDKGHDPGEVDGKMGPKTQQALRDYQQKEGLKASGRVDSETASKLGVQASASGSSSSPAASPSGSSGASSSSPSGSSSSTSSPSGSSSSSTPSGSSSSGGASGSGSSSTGAKPQTK